MRGLIQFAAVCLIGALLGLVSAQQLVGGRFGAFAQTKGAWTVWPAAGLPKTDPYTRAHYLLHGRLPMSNFEALEFEARADDQGHSIDSACTYRILASMPKSRWWSLAAISEDARRPPPADAGAAMLISQQVVYESDGTFKAVLSPEPASGNWFRPAGEGSLVLLLRLYNPEAALRNSPLSADLPRIEREVCR